INLFLTFISSRLSVLSNNHSHDCVLIFSLKPFMRICVIYSTSKIMKEIPPYLMCFSHLRWDFVYQRPQHLLSRFANDCMVYFLEEPMFTDEPESTIQFSRKLPNLWVGVPLISNAARTDVDAVLTQ